MQSAIKSNATVIKIDGGAIQSWQDYWKEMSRAFSFPDLQPCMNSDYHSYYDFMTDLSWLKTSDVILIIENADDFLRDSPSLKDDITEDFKNYLLPFWDDEVVRTVVNGERKDFSVYLVKGNK